ncbi:MAG: biotin--[Oscillospiraceae bacterium]|nr:biotin--[acetyl-CoA-carboxylase] ligase [Oscillospiraceae bacterium]
EMAFEGETGEAQYLITGMGINVSQKPEDFPEEIRSVAVSLQTVLGHPVSRTRLCAALIKELEAAYEAFLKEDKSYRTLYRQRCSTLGKDIFILSGQEKTPAAALDLAEDFGLTVRLDDGSIRTVYAGEVSVRSK